MLGYNRIKSKSHKVILNTHKEKKSRYQLFNFFKCCFQTKRKKNTKMKNKEKSVFLKRKKKKKKIFSYIQVKVDNIKEQKKKS